MITNGAAMRQLHASTRDWYTIANKADVPAEIFIYGEIGWDGVTAEDFVRDLAAIDADTLDVRVNSPGGSVFGGVAIYNALRLHKAKVNVVVDSLAASVAAVITQAGDTRTMVQHSQMMIHEASGIAIGNADELDTYADLLRKETGIIADIFATRSGKPISLFKALMAAETWMTAEETVETGLADSVFVPETADKATAAATVDPQNTSTDLPDPEATDDSSTDFTTLFDRPFANLNNL